MIIFDNENEKKVVLGILGIVARNCNNYWSNKNEIDYDKKEYKEYLELSQQLQTRYYLDDDNVDIVKILYKFLDY